MILQVCFLLYAILTPIVNAMGFTNPNNNAQWRQWDKNGGLDNLRRFFGVYAGNTPSRNNYQQFEPVSRLGYETLSNRGFEGMVDSYLDEVLDDPDDFIPYEFIRWLLQTAPHEDARAISELHQELATYPEVAIRPCFTQSVCDTDIDVMFVVDLTYRAVDILNDGIERNERIKTAFDNYYRLPSSRKKTVKSFGWEFGWNFEAKADILQLLGIKVPNSNAAGTGGVNGKLGFTFVNKVGIYVAGGSGLSRVGTVFDYQFGPAIGVEVVGGVFTNPPFSAQLEKLSATWTRSSTTITGDNFLQFQYIEGTTKTLDASLRVNGPTPAYISCMAGDHEQQIDHEPIVSASCRNSNCDASVNALNVGDGAAHDQEAANANAVGTPSMDLQESAEDIVTPVTRVYTRNCNKKARVVDMNVKIQGEEHDFSDGFTGTRYIDSYLTRETESNVVLVKIQKSKCMLAQGAEFAKAAYDIGAAAYVTATQDNQGTLSQERTDTTTSANYGNDRTYNGKISSKDSQTFLMSSEDEIEVVGVKIGMGYVPLVKADVYGTAVQSDLDDWDGDVMESSSTGAIAQSRSKRAAPLNVIPSSAFADSTSETLVAVKRIKSKFPSNMVCQMQGKGGPTIAKGLRSQLPYPLQFKAGFEISMRVGEMAKSHVKFNLDDERDTLTYNGKNPTKYSLSEAIPTCSTPSGRQIKQTTLVNFNGNIHQGSECVHCPMGKSANQVNVARQPSLTVHTKFDYQEQWSLPYNHAYIFPLGFCSDPENVDTTFESTLVDIDSVTGLSTTKFKHKFCCIDNILWPGKCIKNVPNICLDCPSGSVPNGVFGDYDHEYNLVGEDVRGCHTCRAGKYSSWGRCDLVDSNGKSPSSTRNRWNCGLDKSTWISGGSCSDGLSTSPDTCERPSAMFGTCKHQIWEPSTYTSQCADGSGRTQSECELTNYPVMHRGYLPELILTLTVNNGRCSDSTFTDKTTCESNSVCSDSTFTDKTTCETAGDCSDSTFTDKTTCETAGVCSDSTFTDKTTCETAGVCSDSTFTDKTTCETAGDCSDSTFTDKTTCESNSRCSDSTLTDKTTCFTAGVCSDSTFTGKTTCESNGVCSDSTFTDETNCETAGVCSDSTFTNKTTCETAGDCSDSTFTDETNCETAGVCSNSTFTDKTTCETAGVCSNSTFTNRTNCVGTGDVWTFHTWSNNTWTANTWSNNTWSNNTWAETAGVCSDSTFTDKTTCETDGGRCSDSTFTDRTKCETAGVCSNSATWLPHNRWTPPGRNSRCSDSTFTDKTTCESNGVCSDSTFTDKTTCETAGVCSDSTFTNRTNCVGTGDVWTFHTWSNNTWTETPGVCSDSTFTDKTTCESNSRCSDSTCTNKTACETAGVCSDDRFKIKNDKWTGCENNGVCSDSTSWSNNTCVGTGDVWTFHTWSANTWSNNTWSNNTWSNNTWSNNTWSNNTWSNNTWSNNTWSANTWSANTWTPPTYNDDKVRQEERKYIQRHADNELYCEDHSGRSEQDCYVEGFNINGVNYPASRYGICKESKTVDGIHYVGGVEGVKITRTFYRCANFIEKSLFIDECDDGSGRSEATCTQHASRTHEQCNQLSTPSQWGYCNNNPALSRIQCDIASWRTSCADGSMRSRSECTSPEEGWSLDEFCVDGSGRSQIDCERVPGTWACHVNGEVVNNTYCDSTLVSNRQAWNSTCVDGSGRSEYHCTLGPGKWYGLQTICTQPYWKMPIGGWQRTNCAAVNNYLPQTLPGRCVLECTPYQNDCPWHGEIRLNHLNSKEECESLLASQVAGCVDNSGRNKMDCSAPLGTFYCDDGSKRSEQDCVLGRSTWLSPACDDGSGRSAKECRSQRGIWYDGVCEDGSGRNKEQCEWPVAGSWVDVPQYIQNRDDGSLRPVIIEQGDKVHFGKASCIDCPAGRYQTATGQVTCQQCSTGQYQNMVGQEECKTCPLGWQSLPDRTTCKPQSLNRWASQQTLTHDYGKDSSGNTLSACNTTGRLQKECLCNYNICEKDEFCNLDTSECYQTCAEYRNLNHTKQNQDICGCGDVTCNVNKFCDTDTSRCLEHKFCSSVDGLTAVAQTCTCGTSECSNGEYCDAVTSRCLTNPICSSTDGSTAVAQTCTCGEKTCVSGQYCDAGVCKWVIQSACKQCDLGKYNFDLRQVGGCQAGHSFNGVTSITQTLTASGGFVDQSNSKIANDGHGEITYSKRGWCKDGSGRSEQDCTRDKSEFIGCSDGSARSEWQCKQPSSSWLLQCDDRSGRSETDCTHPRSTWDVTCADSYCADGSGRSEEDCTLPKSSYGIFSDGLTPSYGAVTPSQIQKQADGRVYFEICADGSGRPPETCNIPPSRWVRGCCADGSGRPKIDCLRPSGNWGLCADGSGRTQSECLLSSDVFSAKCTNAAYNTKTSCENAGDSWLSGCVDGSGRSRQNCEIPRSHWEILNPLFYGHDEQCMYTGGNIENPIGCQCGASYCDVESGLFCDGHACRPYGQCLFSNGERMNSGDCLCGNNDCSIGTGLFCKNGQCKHTNVDNTCSNRFVSSGENSGACKCGTKTCNGVTGLYCNTAPSNYCQRYPECQSPNNLGRPLVNEKCECENSGNICNKNQYCHKDGTCSDFIGCWNRFENQMGTEVACKCGTHTCTRESGLFCHDTDDDNEGDTCSPYELCSNTNGATRNEPSSAWTAAHTYMNPNIETTFDMIDSHVRWRCFCPGALTSIFAKYDDDPVDASLEQTCTNSLSEYDVELGEWKNTDGSVKARYPYCYKNDVCSYYKKCGGTHTDNFPKNDNYISESDTLSGNSDGSGWPRDDEACTCGAIICSDNLRMINGGPFSYGHFCNADYKTNGQPTCTNIPVCTSYNGTSKHTGSGHCICSDKVKCSPGQYCDTANHRCSNYPSCPNQDGTQQNTAECICGKQLDTVCNADEYCYGPTSSCSSASGIHDNDYYFTTEDTCEKDGYRTLRDHNPDFVTEEMRCADASRAIALRGEERRLASTLTTKADPYWFVSSQQGAFYIKDEDTPPGCWWNGVRGSVHYNPLSLASEMKQTNLCTSGDSYGCLCQFAQPACQNTNGSAPNDGPCWCWDKPCTAKTGLLCDVQQVGTTFGIPDKKGTCSSTTSNCNDPAVFFGEMHDGTYEIKSGTRCRCNQVTCYGDSPYTTERLGDIGAGKYCNWEASICSEQRIYDCVTDTAHKYTVAGHCSDPEYTTKSSCISEGNGFCSDLRALTKSRCEITFKGKWTLNTWVDSYPTFPGGMCKCADSMCTTATGFNCNGAGLCSHSNKFTVYKEITGATYCGDPNGIGKDLEYILDYGECQKAIANIQTPLVKGTDYNAIIQPRALGAKGPSLYSGTTSTGDANTMTRGCSLAESASYNTYYNCGDFEATQSVKILGIRLLANNWKCSNSALNQLGANAPSYYGSTPDAEICRYGNCNTNLPAGVHPEDYEEYTEDGYPICNPGTYISDVEYACNPSTPGGLRHANSGWKNGGRQSSWVKGSPGCRHETDDGNGCQTSYVSTYGAAVGHNIFIYGDKWENLKLKVTENYDVEKTRVTTNTHLNPGYSWHQYDLLGYVGKTTATYSRVSKAFCSYTGTVCGNVDGTVKNSGTCVCGTTVCNSHIGLWCYADQSLCIPAVYPVVTSGNCTSWGYENIADKATCSAGAKQVGWSDTTAASLSSSVYPQGCFNLGNTLFFNTDTFSTGSCSPSQTCLCVFERPACANGDGITANSVPCVCGTAACTDETGLICASASNTCSKTIIAVLVVVKEGTCSTEGYEYIADSTACEAVAAQIGWSNTTADTNSWSNYPRGCGKHGYSGTQLKFNTQESHRVCDNSNACVCSFTGPTCVHNGGVTANSIPCVCGTAACTSATGLKCNAVTNTCSA